MFSRLHCSVGHHVNCLSSTSKTGHHIPLSRSARGEDTKYHTVQLLTKIQWYTFIYFKKHQSLRTLCIIHIFINRPGVAGAVLQTPPLLINYSLSYLSFVKIYEIHLHYKTIRASATLSLLGWSSKPPPPLSNNHFTCLR